MFSHSLPQCAPEEVWESVPKLKKVGESVPKLKKVWESVL